MRVSEQGMVLGRPRPYQVLHRHLTRLVNALHVFKDVMRERVDNRDSNIIVVSIL